MGYSSCMGSSTGCISHHTHLLRTHGIAWPQADAQLLQKALIQPAALLLLLLLLAPELFTHLLLCPWAACGMLGRAPSCLQGAAAEPPCQRNAAGSRALTGPQSQLCCTPRSELVPKVKWYFSPLAMLRCCWLPQSPLNCGTTCWAAHAAAGRRLVLSTFCAICCKTVILQRSVESVSERKSFAAIWLVMPISQLARPAAAVVSTSVTLRSSSALAHRVQALLLFRPAPWALLLHASSMRGP
jgi:hypothetical protein